MSDDPTLAERLAEHADNIRWDAENSVTVPLLDEAVEALRERERFTMTEARKQTVRLIELRTLLADAYLPCQNPIPIIDGLTRQHREGRCGRCANCKLNELRGTDD